MRKTILIIILVLCSMAVFAADNVLNDNRIQLNNTIINETGVYSQNTKAFARTADVVVCRGTSVLDDIWKSFTCDVVCKSTDTDCSPEIEAVVNNTAINSILIKGSSLHYNLSSRIDFDNRQNFTILGEGASTVLDSAIGAADVLFRTSGNSSNVEIGNFVINEIGSATNVVSIAFDAIGVKNSTNNYIHDIEFRNNKWLCMRMVQSINDPLGVWFENNHIERITCNGGSFTLGQFNHLYMRDIMQNGKSYYNNVAADWGFEDLPYRNNMIDMHVSNYYLYHITSPVTAGGIALGSNTTIYIDNFVCLTNSSCIIYATNDATSHSEVTITNSRFEGFDNGNTLLLNFIIRDSTSIVKISNTLIDGHATTSALNNGIRINGAGRVYNNIIQNFGQRCGLFINSNDLLFSENSVRNCALNVSTWRYITLQASNNSISRNNNFESDIYSTNTVYNLVGVLNSTISGDKFLRINSTLYSIVNSNDTNTTYMDNYVYTTIPICDNNADNPFKDKMIHNTTNSCICVSGVWKCWTMS